MDPPVAHTRAASALRGPGETQLEEDRRLVGDRIRDLKDRLVEVQARKEREVAAAREEHTVSLVGYTNAGKSTLMNALTGAGVYVEDKLFSTLDTRTRQWHLKDWGRVLLSDTVGFIRDLPHHLVASFKATLEEARQARLLLHVVDASSPQAEEQIKAVNEVLKELGCDDKPTLLVLNKIDQRRRPSLPARAAEAPPAGGGGQRRDGAGAGRAARRGDRDAQRRLRRGRGRDRRRPTARCWRTWPPTPRSTARSTTTTGWSSAATCRGTCSTTSRGRTSKVRFLDGKG